MNKRYLKKLLPNIEKIKNNKTLSCMKIFLTNSLYWHINQKSMAKGMAIGIFVALIPLPGQSLIAALLAIYFGGNLLVSIALTWVTNPFTFVPINFFIYKLGQYVAHSHSAFHAMPSLEFFGKSWQEITTSILQWLHAAGKPYLIGLLILIIVLPILGYVLTLFFWRMGIYWMLWKRKRNRDSVR